MITIDIPKYFGSRMRDEIMAGPGNLIIYQNSSFCFCYNFIFVTDIILYCIILYNRKAKL